jgi:lipopolysaccharide transport system ATP-binding protein
MDNDVVVKAENVSKKYCKNLKRSILYGVTDIGRNLCGLSSRPECLREKEFWAIDDVSFELKKGEALGLIGPNGSGKSTLLKMLNGIFWPDKGKISIRGRVGALIEVGAGFHPMLTGRENVYVNAAILGMTKQEVEAKFDDIVNFAEIGDFIDAPVKTYSSGMYVRLGFAVAAHCDPEILLVDEVLAVGDINFQHKCLRLMTDLLDKCTIIFVSHSPQTVRFLCKKVLFLNNGSIKYFGEASKGIDDYVSYMISRTSTSSNGLTNGSNYDSKVELMSIKFFDRNHKETLEIDAGDPLLMECSFNVSKQIHKVIVGVAFYLDARERSFICYSSQMPNKEFYDLANGEHKFHFRIPRVNLKAGIYHIAIIISEKNELASHTWNTNKFIVIKNPIPELGFYNMDFQFEVDGHSIIPLGGHKNLETNECTQKETR